MLNRTSIICIIYMYIYITIIDIVIVAINVRVDFTGERKSRMSNSVSHERAHFVDVTTS